MIDGSLATLADEALKTRDRAAPEVIAASRGRAVALGLPDDDAFWAALEASLDAHLPLFFAHMTGDGGVPAELPEPSVRFARVAVRSGVALTDLLQLLRIVQAPLLGRIGELLSSDAYGEAVGAEVIRFATAYMDWFATALAATYEREREEGGDHRLVLVNAVLGGGEIDAGRLGYGLDLDHLAVVATGAAPREAILALAAQLDRHALCVQPADDVAWGWLGGRRPLGAERREAIAGFAVPAGTALGVGSAATGPEGFRRSHREALAAAARAAPGTLVDYRDIAIETMLLADRDAARALVEAELGPLGADERGQRLRETLRAVFATGNGASAAPRLGVSARTVTHRIAEAEELLGAPIHTRRTELDLALRLEEALSRD